LPDVAHRAHSAPYRERDEDLIGCSLDNVEHRVAAVGRGRDIEEDKLVGAFTVVERG
jgi:hypothetical protein